MFSKEFYHNPNSIIILAVAQWPRDSYTFLFSEPSQEEPLFEKVWRGKRYMLFELTIPPFQLDSARIFSVDVPLSWEHDCTSLAAGRAKMQHLTIQCIISNNNLNICQAHKKLPLNWMTTFLTVFLGMSFKWAKQKLTYPVTFKTVKAFLLARCVTKKESKQEGKKDRASYR